MRHSSDQEASRRTQGPVVLCALCGYDFALQELSMTKNLISGVIVVLVLSTSLSAQTTSHRTNPVRPNTNAPTKVTGDGVKTTRASSTGISKSGPARSPITETTSKSTTLDGSRTAKSSTARSTPTNPTASLLARATLSKDGMKALPE